MEPTTADTGTDEAQLRRRELATKWFIETQMPFITHRGLIPNWFLGFIPRKDAEEMLEEKEQGCFMIRLSDKTVGYVLSFKGRDRCRHFVINQSERGQFIVCGDTKAHNKIVDLLEFYKTNPIEPFGEYLTSSCVEEGDEKSYDVVQFNPIKGKPDTAVKTVRRMHAISLASKQKRTQPHREKAIEVVPPLPQRSPQLNSHVLYAQLRKHLPRRRPPGLHTSSDSISGGNLGGADRSRTSHHNIVRYSLISEPDSVYSEPNLLTSKSRSLPFLDSRCDEKQSYRLSVPPNAPRNSPKPVKPVPRCVSQSGRIDVSKKPGTNMDLKNNSDMYCLAGRASFDSRSLAPVLDEDSLYAEVAFEVPSCCNVSDDTYELIPSHNDSGKHKPMDNVSGTSKNIRSKNDQSSWGLKMSKWKRLFPAVKKKQ
ncbi:hematopoietic SH2 domain-containing protein-like [Gouania willdenowi]|uniref:Hematopoietic SH2 domain-containing protein-like n=1 Tax=Gouania willdenowi TaxID=441366 RepID=A0A8C5GEU2_GOUWI|nr:hematopoietic SH2 domain-containing protein-like [Gouania willdenowi]